MHLAILATNTDTSAFARARPDDGAKFTDLVHLARPDWTTEVFWATRDELPDDPFRFDGIIVTGSPASTNEDAAWVRRLRDFLAGCIGQIPIFAACFGHQIVAQALGGRVVRSPGWAHGLIETTTRAALPFADAPPIIRLYGSHIEQVVDLPDRATVWASSPGTPVAGFLADKLFTTQHHPEMTHEFITDLVEEYAAEVGPEVTARARASLSRKADRALFAELVARFFERSA